MSALRVFKAEDIHCPLFLGKTPKKAGANFRPREKKEKGKEVWEVENIPWSPSLNDFTCYLYVIVLWHSGCPEG
jgi:hypothetical protein